MLKSLKIENFRRFESFELEDLGRINLLVGMNNSGKTSILEAIQLLCSRHNIYMLNQSLFRRGEHTIIENSKKNIELDICHLFFNHELNIGKKILITTINSDDITEQVILSIEESLLPENHKSLSSSENQDFTQLLLDLSFSASSDESLMINFNVEWKWGENTRDFKTSLSPNGGILDRMLAVNQARYDLTHRQKKQDRNSILKTQFLSSSSLTAQEMTELFDLISLMPEESLIYEALQTIEPKIDRIATVSKSRNLSSVGGFFVRFSDSTNRIPLGSLGEGIARLLGLTLSLINAKGGILLVDDIDTGLHFTALSNMWKLIWKIARKLDVQVFATTHSSDCWQSLASIASLEETEQDGITIQRIEKDKQKAIAFDTDEIVVAAKRNIEVR